MNAPTVQSAPIPALARALALALLLLPSAVLASEPVPTSHLNGPKIPEALKQQLREHPKPVTPSGERDARGEVLIFGDDFEGAFPGPYWQVSIANGATNAYWGKQSAFTFQGTGAAFCAGAGSAAVSPGSAYPNNMETYMVVGPFSLADATAAGSTFALANYVEDGFDSVFWFISADGFTTYDGWTLSLDTNWDQALLDFSNTPAFGWNFLGTQQVWFMIGFSSDENTAETGAFVDNVILMKTTASPTATPSPTPTPSASPTPSATPSPSPSPSSTPTPTATPSPTPQGALQKTFTVHNDGDAGLSVTQVSREGGSAWLAVSAPSPLPVAVAPGGQALFTVTVNPAGLSNGTYTDRLLVFSNDSAHSPYAGGVNITYRIGTQVSQTEVVNFLLSQGGTSSNQNGDGVIDVADVIMLTRRRDALALMAEP